MNKLSIIFAAAALGVSASPAAAAVTIDFGASQPLPGAPVGTSKNYSALGSTIVASGFDAVGAATALYEKNSGSDEVGLGIANGTDHEITYHGGFVQIDVSALLNKISGLTFSTNSLSLGEQWTVYGSDTSGSLGIALASNTTSPVAGFNLLTLGTKKYNYYNFASTSYTNSAVTGSHNNFLIHGLTMTEAVPEPGTWATMMLGFGFLGLGFRRRRPARALSAA